MIEVCATVSLEHVSLESVSSELDRLNPPGWKSFSVLGLVLSISDRAEAYELAEKYVKERGMSDDRYLPLGIVGSSFGVEIDIGSPEETIGSRYLCAVADGLANYLSEKFRARTMLQLGNVDRPLFVYDSGVAIYADLDSYRGFLREQKWWPSGLLGGV
jgi:hypothetical protein